MDAQNCSPGSLSCYKEEEVEMSLRALGKEVEGSRHSGRVLQGLWKGERSQASARGAGSVSRLRAEDPPPSSTAFQGTCSCTEGHGPAC